MVVSDVIRSEMLKSKKKGYKMPLSEMSISRFRHLTICPFFVMSKLGLLVFSIADLYHPSNHVITEHCIKMFKQFLFIPFLGTINIFSNVTATPAQKTGHYTPACLLL